MTHFDYRTVAREASISSADLEKLCSLCRKEFPHDDMMFELHVLRAAMSVKDGSTTIKEILSSEHRQAVS